MTTLISSKETDTAAIWTSTSLHGADEGYSKLDHSSPYASILSLPHHTANVHVAGTPELEHRTKTKRSHTKSRRGCYNCKLRRIKCQESWPSCENCLKRGGPCKYPPPIKAQTTDISILVEPQSLPRLFTMQDMRLLSHFIVKAHPHLPINHDEVWSRDIPAIAHEYEFLMHAMLALSASHLALATRSDLSGPALSHRQIAIRGLNETLSAPLTAMSAHAMLATCYALTFQSSYMGDGFAEFITMVRGCALLVTLIVQNKLAGPFNNLASQFVFSDEQSAETARQLESFPKMAAMIVDSAVSSLLALEPTNDLEKMYHQLLLDAVVPMKTSPKDGYTNYVKVYDVFTALPQSSIDYLVDPKNLMAQVLHAHFIGVQCCLAPMSVFEMGSRTMKVPIEAMLTWIETMAKNVGPEMELFMQWPMEIAVAGRRHTGTEPLMNGAIIDLIVNQPESLIELDLD